MMYTYSAVQCSVPWCGVVQLGADGVVHCEIRCVEWCLMQCGVQDMV